MEKALAEIGIQAKGLILRNLKSDELIQEALDRKEGVLSETGALSIRTGERTGRSPKDRFFVTGDFYEKEIYWNSHNIPTDPETFDRMYKKITNYLSGRNKLYVHDGRVGASKSHSLRIRVVTDQAAQSLCARNMFIRLNDEDLRNFQSDFTLIMAPNLKTDPKKDGTRSDVFIGVHLSKKTAIVIGSGYGGEIKKTIFTVMNFFMPKQGILPMHCGANMGEKGDTALFFGLSGTGKTTLSADPNRKLIGDDEHGWSENGIFNFEGGCYAKTYKLDPKAEPQIYNAIRHGSVVENVVMDDKGNFDFADTGITENGRASYPIEFIDNAELSGKGGIPKTIFFLTADAFGVMPPVAKLDYNAAMYHFISGYTSKLAGTEAGIDEPQATFSSFFGAPFMPHFPMVYADMLGDLLKKYKTEVYLVNTGWVGGPYGIGERISIKNSRAIVTAALNGDLSKADYVIHPYFNLPIPTSCPGVDSQILDPINTWKNKEAYEEKANELAKRFVDNFSKFNDIPQNTINAGPKPITINIKTPKIKVVVDEVKVRK